MFRPSPRHLFLFLPLLACLACPGQAQAQDSTAQNTQGTSAPSTPPADANSKQLQGVEAALAATKQKQAALAAAAGVMTGLIYQQLNPYMGFGTGLKAFTAAVIGGIGNIAGAVLGGLLIGLIQTFTVAYLSSTFSDLILFSILVLFMLFRPTSIRGAPVLQKV